MKRLILTLGIIMYLFVANATNDTTIIATTHYLQTTTEQVVDSKGESKTHYYFIYDGQKYMTTKASFQRNTTYKRFGRIPTYAMIKNSRSKACKLVIL